MGTNLIWSATLLLVAATLSASNASTSSGVKPTVETPSSAQGTSVDGSFGTKTKRGIVSVGSGHLSSQGFVQQKPANPSASPTTVHQASGVYKPQNINIPVTYSFSHQLPGVDQGHQQQTYTPYTAQNVEIPAANYGGNAGQIRSISTPGYTTSGQSGTNAAQAYGAADLGETAALAGFLSSSSQSAPTGAFPGLTSFQNILPATASQGQNGQLQSALFSTPYFSNYGVGSAPVKVPTDKSQRSEQTSLPTYASGHQSAAYSSPAITAFPDFSTFGNLQSGIPANAFNSEAAPQKSANFADMYAPQYQSATNFLPKLQEENGYHGVTVDFEGQKIPLNLLQLKSAQDFPGFGQNLQAQPFVLATNPAPYQVNPDFGFLANFAPKVAAPQPADKLQPFLAPQSQPQQFQQQQVLPVQSANGTPRFPQYKGASIDSFPAPNFGRPDGSYQPLKAQPQLHFNPKPAAPQTTSPIIGHSFVAQKPTSAIRDDVEVIKKKKPIPPSRDVDEDELDEGYKAIEREYGAYQVEDDASDSPNTKYSKDSNDANAPASYPFRHYDETFSKNTAPASDEQSDDDGSYTKSHRYQSSADDDDESYDGYSTENHPDYRSPEARRSKYRAPGADDEERASEQQEEADFDDPTKPASFSSYGKDFEEEFEESYKRELPKSDYTHTKEVPEIDEPASSSRSSYTSPESPKYSYAGKSQHQAADDDSNTRGSPTSKKYRKAPKYGHGAGEGSGSSYGSYEKSPSVINEESFGYRKPKTATYAKHTKGPSGQSYSATKKGPNQDSYVHASRSSYKSPKKGDNAFENGDSYSYSSGSSWKSDQKSPSAGDSQGHASSLSKTRDQSGLTPGFEAPANTRGQYYYSKSEQLVRDLTGI